MGSRIARVETSSALPGEPMPLDLAAMYEEHAVFVWRSLRLLGVAPDSLDDAVQEVFLVVHRRLGEFQGRSSVRTWLYAIARRVARNFRRGASRRGPQEPLAEDVSDMRPADPRELAEKAEAGRFLLDLLGHLTDDQREVFLLVEVEEMSVPEAAEALGTNLNTCYSRLRAARRRFERVLAARQVREDGGRR
ncbi:MAG TPA: RNA polymerase sigma factor [Kofleriaceae bacterium]